MELREAKDSTRHLTESTYLSSQWLQRLKRQPELVCDRLKPSEHMLQFLTQSFVAFITVGTQNVSDLFTGFWDPTPPHSGLLCPWEVWDHSLGHQKCIDRIAHRREQIALPQQVLIDFCFSVSGRAQRASPKPCQLCLS